MVYPEAAITMLACHLLLQRRWTIAGILSGSEYQQRSCLDRNVTPGPFCSSHLPVLPAITHRNYLTFAHVSMSKNETIVGSCNCGKVEVTIPTPQPGSMKLCRGWFEALCQLMCLRLRRLPQVYRCNVGIAQDLAHTQRRLPHPSPHGRHEAQGRSEGVVDSRG